MPEMARDLQLFGPQSALSARGVGRTFCPGGPSIREAPMTSDIRRHWHVALATLLIWCAAGPLGSIVQAADENPAQVSDAESRALADRLDALVEQATERVGQPGAEGGAPEAEVIALRERLEAAETQIALLKNVVIQALRAQSAAEEALHREQAAGHTPPTPEVARSPAGPSDLMLA